MGIVDGAMGILSRKMAMQGEKKGDAASAADMVKVNKKLTNPYTTNTKPQPHP